MGSVEAGGTNIVCSIGSADGELAERVEFATEDPVGTLRRVHEFFEPREIAALGLGWFGPIEVRPSHPRYGTMGPTPKPGWEGADVLGPLKSLGVPLALATDVAAAALGEGEWGASAGLTSHVYVTVGTGIGGAAVVDGAVLGGIGHPEMGHIPVARVAGDDFAGVCPFHEDCLEGMAAGPAVAARWGSPAEDLEGNEAVAATELVAGYLAQGVRAITYTIAPERIVVGGGIARLPGFHAAVREALVSSFSGYPGLPEHRSDEFVVPPGLGDFAGVKGGLVLARRVSSR